MGATLFLTKQSGGGEEYKWHIRLRRGLSIDQYRSYSLIENAVRAAKKVAKQYRVQLTEAVYTEEETGYYSKLHRVV